MRAVGPDDHGHAYAYWRGCRCDACRGAASEYVRLSRWRRRSLKEAGVLPVPHGTENGYSNHHCRCDDCRTANTAAMLRYRAARRARLQADPSLREHGTTNTYEQWGCRCETCVVAMAARRQAWKRGESA